MAKPPIVTGLDIGSSNIKILVVAKNNKEADLGSIAKLAKTANLGFLKKYSTFAIAEYSGEEVKPGPKIQWVVADSSSFTNVQVIVPDVLFIDDEYNENSLKIEEGVGEAAIKNLLVDDLVQFERYGFVRIDQKQKDKIIVNLAHK